MAKTLFVYGTLQDPLVLGAVLGPGAVTPGRAPAIAPGFAAVVYPGAVYPGLVARPGASARGAVLTGLSAADWARLDAYEGDHYRLGPITIAVGRAMCEAVSYFPTRPIGSDAPLWDLERWSLRYRQDALAEAAALL